MHDDSKGNNTIAFENPYMTEPIINGLKSKLLGFRARKMSIKFVGDIEGYLKTGKYLFAEYAGTEYKIPIMQITHSWDGGLITEVTSTCETESENEIDIKGPMTQSIEKVKTMIAENDIARYLITPEGYQTDLYGNIRHKTNSDEDYFAIQDTEGNDKIKINYEKGQIDLNNDLVVTEILDDYIYIREGGEDEKAIPVSARDVVIKEKVQYGLTVPKIKQIRLVTPETFMGNRYHFYAKFEFYKKLLQINGTTKTT